MSRKLCYTGRAVQPGADTGNGSRVDFSHEVIARARKVVEKNAALAKVYGRLLTLVAETTRNEFSPSSSGGKRHRLGGPHGDQI